MKLIGNIFWLIFGGIEIALVYFVIGLLYCCTIIGIPFGLQLFKFAKFCLMPFSVEVVDSKKDSSFLTILMNLLWILLGWWEIACMHLAAGLVFCITIVGIPLGVQHFKMIGISLMPFGKEFN